MSNTVSFKIKIDDSGTFKTVTADAGELGKVIDEVKIKAKELNKQVIESASISQVVEGAKDALGQLASALDSLSQAYYEDEEAATTLAKVMENTMGATAEEVAEIGRYISAQEKAGVVSGGVQTAAARELSTYLTLTSSLKTLIPVLNDMGVHQYGVAVSAEQLTQIATMMGKVMDGQVEALSRAGYKFDDAQKYILKFGEESERAAVLAQVVSESVGGINAAQVDTAAGHMQQFRNQMEGVKSAVGGVVSVINPFIQGFAGVIVIIANITQLKQSFVALSSTMVATKAHSLALASAQRLQAAACKVLGVSALAAKTATGALKAEIIATEAAITLGLSLAISALVEGLSRLMAKSDDAADSVDEISDAERAYKEAAAQARAETAADIVALEDLIKSKANEGEKVDELNSKYGEALGTYSTAAEWYDVLTSKSEAYCKQLAYEAMAAKYKDQLAEAMIKQAEAQKKVDDIKASGNGYNKKIVNPNGLRPGLSHVELVETEELKEANAALKAAQDEVGGLTSEMTAAMKMAGELTEEIKTGASDAGKSWKEMSLDDLSKAIDLQEKKVKSLAGTSKQAAAKEEASILRQMKARKTLLETKYDIGNGGAKSKKDPYDGTKEIENPSTIKEIANNIKYWNAELEKKNTTDKQGIAAIASKITALEKEKKAIEQIIAESADKPATLDNLKDIDDEIKRQQSLRASATKEELAGIDAEINRLNDLKTAFENSSHRSLKEDEIKTYKQLENEIAFYSSALDSVTKDKEPEIRKHIKTLMEIKEAWDEARFAAETPAPIEQLETVEELDKAIEWYSAKQKKSSENELKDIQRTIDALNRKKKAVMSFVSIDEMQTEINGLTNLNGRELKLELELMGLDDIRNKIRGLQKLLKNTENPLDTSQRKQVEELVASYSKYEKVLKASNLSFREAWGAVSGIGNGIKNLTGTLKGDGDAWDKICGSIGAMLQLYDGFSSVITIVETLVGLSNAMKVAKEGEGTAALAAGVQEQTGAAMAVSANVEKAATEGAVTNANVGAAVSGVLAAHSEIPFVGLALGLAAVAAIIGVMASLPKFANGGIAYGPTLGLFGEYPGAASDPEVVAPLSKLKGMLAGVGTSGNVEFHIKGRDLYGVLDRENYRRRRTE